MGISMEVRGGFIKFIREDFGYFLFRDFMFSACVRKRDSDYYRGLGTVRLSGYFEKSNGTGSVTLDEEALLELENLFGRAVQDTDIDPSDQVSLVRNTLYDVLRIVVKTYYDQDI